MKTLASKKARLIVVLGCAMMLLAAIPTIAQAAVPPTNPAGLVAELTGRTADAVMDERFESGKSYGTIADEAGVLDQFKNRILELNQQALQARVTAGTMTQEQADARMAQMEQRQALCDGTGAGYMAGERGFNRGAGLGTGVCLADGTGIAAGTGLGATDNPTPGTCTGIGTGIGVDGQSGGFGARGR